MNLLFFFFFFLSANANERSNIIFVAKPDHYLLAPAPQYHLPRRKWPVVPVFFFPGFRGETRCWSCPLSGAEIHFSGAFDGAWIGIRSSPISAWC